MDADEKVLWACLPGDYSGDLVFFFENGKAARVALSAYQTQTRRKKLIGAFSDKSPVVKVLWLKEDQDLGVAPTLVRQSCSIPPCWQQRVPGPPRA